jgi:hypothetical protein
VAAGGKRILVFDADVRIDGRIKGSHAGIVASSTIGKPGMDC